MISRVNKATLALLLALQCIPANTQRVLPTHDQNPQMKMAESKPTHHQSSTSGNAGQSATATRQPKPGVVQSYFIAADEVQWDYTPGGRNLAGLPRPESADDESASGISHRIYHKAIYRRYTDSTFKTTEDSLPIPIRVPWHPWSTDSRCSKGIQSASSFATTRIFQSPCIRTVSNTPKMRRAPLMMTELPALSKRTTLYVPAAPILTSGQCLNAAARGLWTESSVLWMYHSHFVESTSTSIPDSSARSSSHLKAGHAKPDGSPDDVTREFITDFAVFDETDSWFFRGNLGKQARAARLKAYRPYPSRPESSLLHQRLRRRQSADARDAEKENMSVGTCSPTGMKTTYTWRIGYGNTVVWNNVRMDSISLGPMAMAIADMVPDIEGTWLFHCHVADHYKGGMVAQYQLEP